MPTIDAGQQWVNDMLIRHGACFPPGAGRDYGNRIDMIECLLPASGAALHYALSGSERSRKAAEAGIALWEKYCDVALQADTPCDESTAAVLRVRQAGSEATEVRAADRNAEILFDRAPGGRNIVRGLLDSGSSEGQIGNSGLQQRLRGRFLTGGRKAISCHRLYRYPGDRHGSPLYSGLRQ